MENLITLEDLNGALNSLTREQTMELRSQYIPKACKLHFEKSPMKVIRASGQYLYDDEGAEYLDCVNCVAHVGHCNPLVVEAAKTAMMQMGSISIGMTDLASDYISKLRVTFPPEIDTFLFVSSGSEANDLAIQLARLYTGNTDVVSVDRSFHGGGLTLPNTVSPKQFSSEMGCPEWVHVLQCPDLYRGKYRENDDRAVENYCVEAKCVMDEAVKRKRKLACFICEPLITIAGVIVPPSKWLHSIYKDIRSHGGLAIADEAQSGLGRCGSSFWCFQMHENLVPDIITIGKPLGNGYPMACVATRSEIAAALTNHFTFPSYQNDYACDLVTASIGSAVLNTIGSLSLQQNARSVGEFLKEGMGIRALGQEHYNIGQVRGCGLMIGVEIVYNQESRKPASDVAEHICYKMLEHYIIVGNDGPHKNVLIFTPPMCFTCENAHRVIIALGKVLTEIQGMVWSEAEVYPPTSSSSQTENEERLLSLDELFTVTNEENEGERHHHHHQLLSELEMAGSISEALRRPTMQNSSPSTILSSESFLDDLGLDEEDGGYATSNSFASLD